MYTVAVDIGGTNIAAGILNSKREWVMTLQNKSDTRSAMAMYRSLLETIYDVVKKAQLKVENIKKIGLTVPGQFDINQGLAIYQNNLPWSNFEVGKLLKEEFPNKLIVFEHDVVAAALGEWAIRNLSDELFVYLTVSTGIAASIIENGRVIRGAGLAGEIGLIPMDENNSLEDWTSGSAMEKEVKEMFAMNSLRDAFNEWKKGNQPMGDYFNKKAKQLAYGIFVILATLDPHKVVLGGGVMYHQPAFIQLIKGYLMKFYRHPFQENWHERIEGVQLKGTSGLYGVGLKAQGDFMSL